MDRKQEVGASRSSAIEYRTPELAVHGDVARLTGGPGPGSADTGAQTSTLPGDFEVP